MSEHAKRLWSTHKIVAGAAIILAVAGAKLAFQHEVYIPSGDRIVGYLTPSLQAAGYQIGGTLEQAGRAVMLVRKDACMALISYVTVDGAFVSVDTTFTEADKQWLGNDIHVAYAFDGAGYAQNPPRWRPIAYQQVYKFLTAIGLQPRFPTVYVLRLGSGCGDGADLAATTSLSQS